mmetsp:Transcript_9617/g.24723  ORF Transcript_9617/g.24723 Transcript_9617/m.24723 type:complete len:279 (-) Transcript_9617:2357-3193(-)
MHFGVWKREALDHHFHRVHPRLGQVAILQENPRAVFAGLCHHLFSDWPLTLAESHGFVFVAKAHVLGESHELCHGVRARRQDEDQWHCLSDVLIHRLQIHGRRLYKLLAELSGDKLLGRFGESVRLQRVDQDQLFKRMQFGIPFVRLCQFHTFLLWWWKIKPWAAHVVHGYLAIANLNRDRSGEERLCKPREVIGNVSAQIDRRTPQRLLHPWELWFGWPFPLSSPSAAQKVIPRLKLDAIIATKDFTTQHEREYQVVLFEKTASNVGVYHDRRVLDN